MVSIKYFGSIISHEVDEIIETFGALWWDCARVNRDFEWEEACG